MQSYAVEGELIKHKIAGLQRLLDDDVVKRRAVALESGSTTCENHCGALQGPMPKCRLRDLLLQGLIESLVMQK